MLHVHRFATMGRSGRIRGAAAAAGAVSLACTLAACSSSPSPAAAGASNPSTVTATYTGSAVVDLNFWSWTLNSQAVVDEFNKTHPNIHVNFTQITGGAAGYSKLFDAFKAGDGPDVFNCEYDMVPQFVSQGLVQDLSQYVTPQLKSELGASLGLTTMGGKTWAIPFDLEPTLLWYRADLFKKYGLAVPTTWAQFQSEAQTVKQKDPGASLGLVPTSDALWLGPLAEQAGATWYSTSGDTWKVDLTDPASEKVATYWQSLVAGGLVAAGSTNSPQIKADYANGSVLTMIEPAYEGAYIKSGYPAESGDWAVAPLPTWGSAADGTEGGSSYPVSKSASNAAAAAEFAEWMSTTSDGVATRLQGGKSSNLPADTQLSSVAAQAFAGSDAYFGGQDVLGVAASEAAVVPKTWVWGPEVTAMATAMGTPMGKVGSGGTIASALQAGQDSAVSLMKAAGLSVSAG